MANQESTTFITAIDNDESDEERDQPAYYAFDVLKVTKAGDAALQEHQDKQKMTSLKIMQKERIF
jgi:hypothetical protein